MSQKQKAVTVHGEIEYNTVECASCNQEFLKKDTDTLYRGHIIAKPQGKMDKDTEFKFKHKPTKIIMCENCIENPQKITIESLFYSTITGLLMGICIWMIVAVFLL